MLEKLRLTSPKPGHAERVRTPLSPAPDHSHQRFLKINVRHITDGQVFTYLILLDIPLQAQMWHGRSMGFYSSDDDIRLNMLKDNQMVFK